MTASPKPPGAPRSVEATRADVPVSTGARREVRQSWQVRERALRREPVRRVEHDGEGSGHGREEGRMVDALASTAEEGRGHAAKRSGEALAA